MPKLFTRSVVEALIVGSVLQLFGNLAGVFVIASAIDQSLPFSAELMVAFGLVVIQDTAWLAGKVMDFLR